MKSYKAKFLQILITAEGFSVLHFFSRKPYKFYEHVLDDILD